jgi:DNA helicase-2/ATP-dependent DNA helicase PcrA
VPVDLKYSGRSARSIIDLANYLNRWSQSEHPVPELRGTLTEPLIHPTPPGDPQPNPRIHPVIFPFIRSASNRRKSA